MWIFLFATRSASGEYRPPSLNWDFSRTSSADSALCGSWPADYAARHSAIRQASAVAHAAHVEVIKRSRRSGVFAWFSPAPPPRPYDPAVRFLTFEWLDGCGGYGDALNGLMLAFVTAVLDGRALIVNHDCLPAAFLPAMIDWRLSDDVPLEPATVVTPPGYNWDGVVTDARPDAPAKAGEVVRLDMRNSRVELETFFKALENATNIRLAANLGALTHLATKAKGEWAERFKGLGIRLPYAMGCFFRFLLRPRDEVRELFHSTMQKLRGNSTATAMEQQRVATVGIHIRVQDEVVWAGDRGKPKDLEQKQIDALLGDAKQWLDCAQRVEEFWFPSSLAVRWMLITNSAQLKAAIKSKYPDKVVTTEFVPRHSNSLASVNKKDGFGIEGSKQDEARMFQEVVTEWLLLAASDAYVISRSGYSHTAVFYSMRTLATFEYDRCDPEQPTEVTYMGEDWSGI
ncbi:unnamed protein product [Closterium sp. NIES-65]|nr:unnamed protein product [Closterium sp. NIES-65]